MFVIPIAEKITMHNLYPISLFFPKIVLFVR